MAEIKEIEISVTELVTKDGSNRKFNAYKALTKTGAWMDCRFRKEVKNLPKENSIIKVAVDKMNIARNRKWPILWVQEIIEVIPLSEAHKENTEVDKIIIDETF